MNKHITKFFLALATVAIVGGGCNVNDYNEEYLEGYDKDSGVTDVQTLKYTLTDADYKAIANNKTNQDIAKAAGNSEALAALGNNKFFTEQISAATYVPAFLAAAYDTYLSNGSSIEVTYNNGVGYPEELTLLAAAKTYTVSSDDYAKIWGEVPANYFTPEKPLANSANKILQAAYPDAATGEIKVVAYNYSATEPNTGGTETATSIDETFDGGLNAWQIVKGSSSSTWTLDDFSGVKSAKCSAFKTEGPQDLWLISEKVNLSAATAPQLGFDVKISYWNHDGLSVLVSTDYNGMTPEDATWTDITHNFAFEPKSSGKWYIAGVCDMSAFKAESVYVAFRYVGNAAENKTTTYYIDNIQLGDEVVNIDETTLFEDPIDDFDNWSLVKVAGEDANQWVIKTFSGNTYAQASANKAAGAVESWLVTKQPVAVPALTSGVSVLGFDLKIGYWNANCFSVLISEDYTGDVATATWSDVSSHLLIPEVPTSSYASDFSAAGVAPLYLYAGKSVYVAFKYVGDGANKKTTTYQIDNIKVSSLARAAAPKAITRAITQERLAIYTYSGSAWQPMSNTTIVNPEDYTEMGASNPNFSASFSADKYLPLFLKYKYPYAVDEDYMDVAYHFYNGTATSLRADRYNFDGNNWGKFQTYETLSGQFLKSEGKWAFNPSRTIALHPDKSPLSKQYYQACVDWVIANKNAAYTTKNPDATRLTQSEFYSGCASDYTNLNWRINTLPKHYWSYAGDDVTVYADYISEDKATARAAFDAFYKETEKRFGEVMSAALGTLHADQKVIPGMDIIYTLQMMIYSQHIASSTGKVTHAFEFKLVDNGKFEYVRMYALAPEFELMRDENFN